MSRKEGEMYGSVIWFEISECGFTPKGQTINDNKSESRPQSWNSLVVKSKPQASMGV